MAATVAGTMAAAASTGARSSTTHRGTRAEASSAASITAVTATTTAPPPPFTQPPASTAHAVAAIRAAQRTGPSSDTERLRREARSPAGLVDVLTATIGSGSAGLGSAIADAEHVAAAHHPPVEGQPPRRRDAQRGPGSPEGGRLHEDAEMALAARGHVHQRLHPTGVAIGGDHHQATAAPPALAVAADGVGEREIAVVLGERQVLEDAQALRLTAARAEGRVLGVVGDQPDRLPLADRRMAHGC